MKKLWVSLFVILSFVFCISVANAEETNTSETISVMVRYTNSETRTISDDTENIGNGIEVVDISADEISLYKDNANVGYVEEDVKVKKSTLADDWYIDFDNIREIYNDLSYRGENVKVAVLDTGVSFCNGKTVSGGINILDSENGYGDDNGHGTSMANIITAIAPEVDIYSVKVLDSNGEGYYSDIIEGINWSIENDIDIICMSFGAYDYSYFLEEAIDNAFNSDITLIAASGNDSAEKMHYPAAYNQVIAVGACDENGIALDFTNGKELVDVYAPGAKIIVENHRSTKLSNKGTSVSAAQVVGVISLMKSAKTDSTNKAIYSSLNHSVKISEGGYKILDGYSALSNINAFIDNPEEYIPTLDKTYIETEDGKVAVSYKYTEYDYQTVSVNDSVTVRAGFYSSHDYCDITVYKKGYPNDILDSERRSPVSGGAYITYTCPEDVLSSAGTYEIRYHASGNGTDTTYDDVFTIYVESIDDDDYEYNDTYSTATTLSGYEGTIYANINSSTDEDYYKTYLEAGETIDITLSGLGRDYELYLYEPDYSYADDSTYGGTTDESIIYTAVSTGYHYINVYGYDEAFCSTEYTLSYSVDIPGDEYEEHKNYANVTVYHNDTLDYRSFLNFTNSITIYPTISYPGDEDWFEIEIPEGQMTILLEDLPKDYDLYLYSEDETLLARPYKGGTTSEEILYEVLENSAGYETLYIRIDGYSDNCSREPYTLTIDHARILNATVSPKKNTADVHWTTAFKGNSVVNYGTDNSVSSKKSDTTWVTEHDISITGLTTATKYYYKVTTTGYPSIASDVDTFYTKDRYEDNDDFDTATTISSVGQEFNGTIHSIDDEDYYKVSLDVPGVMYLWLENVPSNCDYELWLMDADGEYLWVSDNLTGEDEYIEYFVYPGTYYICIETVTNYDGDSPYLFTYDFDAIYYNDVYIIDELHMGGDGTYSPTGNYSKTFADLEFTNSAYDYYVGRTYNSRDKVDTHLGRGWMFSFEGKVSDLERTFEYSNGNIGTYIDDDYKMVKLPDSSTYIFEKQSNGTFVAQDSRATLVNNGSGYTFTTQDKKVYTFNTSGYLTSMKDKYGNGMTITVNSSGKVQSFVDPTGNTYTVTYGSNGYISAVTENVTGRTVTYSYTNNLLTSVVNPTGITTYYEYDSDKYISAIKNNENVTVESLTYVSADNEAKKINTVTDAYGNVRTYTYNESENKTVITDSNGRTNTQSYDDTKFITSIIDAAGRTRAIQYTTENGKNKYGEIASLTDEIGNTTAYERDTNGNVTKQTNPDGSYTDYAYDTNNNLVWERDSLGNFTLYQYDTNGVKLVKKAKYLNKVGANETVELTSSNSDMFAVEEYAYYADTTADIKGLLYQYKNAEGYITEYTYDSNGNPLTVKDPETGLKTQYTYNDINYTTSKTTPKGYVTQYVYDNSGNLVKETNTDDGGVSRTVYDGNGRKVLEINPQHYSSTNDPLNVSGNVNSYSDNTAGTKYEYYSNGLVKKITSPEGDVTEYTYDLYGNVLTETVPCQFDEEGNKKTEYGQYIYEYDNLNRLTAVKFKETPSTNAITLKTVSYSTEQSDNEYLVVQTETTYYDATNSSAVVSKSKYNDKVVFVGYADGTSENYTYYADGELKTSTDGNGNTTHYNYNTFDTTNNVVYHEVWSPAGGGYSYARTDYDLSGNMVAEYKSNEIVELNSVPQNLYKRSFVYYKNGKLKQEYDSEGRKTEYEYDNDGNVSKMSVYTDSDSKNITEYINNSRGQVVTETNHISSDTIYNDSRNTLVTTFTYDLNGNLLTKTTPDGVVVSSTYDKQNRAVTTSQSLTDENDEVRTAVIEEKYNSNDNVYYRKDAKGAETFYVYDNRGLCVKEINPLGGITLNYYDFAGRLTNTVKPNAYSETGTLQTMNNTEYVYNCKDLVVKKIEHYLADGASERSNVTVSEATYDANGNMLTEKDALGNITTYTYTPNNKIKTKLTAQSAEDGLTYTLQYMYNGMGQVVSTTNANGVITSVTYDAINNVLTKSVSQGDETATIEANTYDKAGNLLSQTDGNDNTVTYTYNALGKISSITEPSDDSIAGNVITKKYALNGNVAYEINSLGTETLYSYDEAGRNTAITIRNDSATPLTTSMKYDLSGNVVKEIDGNGNAKVYTYDLLNRKTSETVNNKTTQFGYDENGNNTSMTDWRGNTSTRVYDALDRLVKVYDVYGKLISEKTYNANNTQISDKDALGAITQYQYDKDNRLIATIDALNHSTQKAYDAVGNVISETDPNGNVKTFAYDKLNNLISVTQTVNGANENTSYTYDNCGNILTQTDAKGNITKFEYNAANLISKKIFHGGESDETKQESYTYYADGTMATKTDRNGVIISYTYDIVNRPVQTVAGSKTVTNSYDAAGNKLSVTDSIGSTIRTYDAEGRVLTKGQPNIGTFTYTYDVITDVPEGEYDEISVNPANLTNKKVFDKAGRLHFVYDGNDLAATYTYYDNGALQKVVYGNGASEEYTYFADGNLQTLINKNAEGTVTDQYTYAYDSNGNQTSKTEIIASVNKGTTNYSYNELDQLMRVVEPSGKTTDYSYDKAGNRVSEIITDNGTTTSTVYTYDELNRLLKTVTTYEDAVITYDYQYDYNGNLYSKTKSTQGSNSTLEKIVGMTFAGETENGVSQYVEFYEYDEFNQLVKLMNGASVNAYAYNGEGMRVAKTVGDATTLYGYEYDKPVVESDGTNFTAVNLYGTNLISRTAENQTLYYQFNGHADVIGLIDEDGVLVASYYYDAFGVPTVTSGDIENPFRYGGYLYDEETGLYYIKSRFYDASIARFIQEDIYAGKYSDPLSLNLYTYVLNNPLRYLDPTGMIPDEIKLNGQSIGYLKGMRYGIYGSIADLNKAYGYKRNMSVKNGVYTFTFNDIKMVIDIKDKSLNTEHKMNVKGDRFAYDYPYFVLVKDEDNAGCVKILVNVDMFSKVVADSSGKKHKPEKTYTSVDSFVKDIEDLEDAARKYKGNKDNKTINNLVLNQIRYDDHNYTGAMWSPVAGTIDTGFTDYVAGTKGYLNFYGDVYLKDTTSGGKVDIPHLAATLNALQYNTAGIMEFGASFAGAGGSEEQIDNLAGWAGDLQTLIKDLHEDGSVRNRNDYGQNYAAVSRLIATDGTMFSHKDMLADIDAVNIDAHLDYNNGSLSSNFKGYYNNTYQGTKVSTRYTSFLTNAFGTTNKETIRKYVGDYLYEDSLTLLMNRKKIYDNVTDAEKRALRDGFLNYVYNVNSGK